MARKTVVKITDDLDGTELPDGEGESVRFALDGAEYELDLSAANAQGLRDAITPYIESGRRTGGRRRSGGHTRQVSTEVDTRAVRAWANAKGIKVSSRGRVPQDVIDQYRNAGN
ncbi:histone-like nucleoid-structuring protein Lsr2 [Solicola gregarius]|uniref:Lsr2 family protein n=1 Tax=Solicola gregarius TaxID=2908642 RepID=A0AA46TFT3_9ACTN|nr:Lsr2 family protein [Solicola gregarius]UYM04069.1 Lsr2 family protein [Solicola gregarius]